MSEVYEIEREGDRVRNNIRLILFLLLIANMLKRAHLCVSSVSQIKSLLSILQTMTTIQSLARYTFLYVMVFIRCKNALFAVFYHSISQNVCTTDGDEEGKTDRKKKN